MAVLLRDQPGLADAPRAGGSSLDFGRAARKARGEAIERMDAAGELDVVVRCSYDRLDELAVDPASFDVVCAPSPPLRSDDIGWVRGWHLGPAVATGLLPAQCVSLPYELLPDEPLWFQPTSNGLASADSLERACWSALLEIIERDAFMTSWLRRTPPRRIPPAVDRSSALTALIDEVRRYRLDLAFYVLESVTKVPTVMAVVSDPTRVGPHTSIGFKCDADAEVAMLGALEEALQLRPWLRELKERDEPPRDTFHSIEDRAHWLTSPGAKAPIDDYLDSELPVSESATWDFPSSLRDLVARFTDAGLSVWVSPALDRTNEISTVRALVPGLQMPYFDETMIALTRCNETAHGHQDRQRHPLL